MILIREANVSDNSQLIELQARCPQGTNLVVSAVNTPDFFARARAYEEAKVYVACDDNRIVGSAACAVRDAVIGKRVARVGYEFQVFVATDYRRRGVASQLLERREDYLIRRGVELTYSLIIEGNTASMQYTESRGFRHHRWLVMPGLGVVQQAIPRSKGQIRRAERADLGAIASLLNETWQAYDLYEPTSPEALARSIDRRPAYSLDDLFVLEDSGEIVACLGLWDWSQIAQITVRATSLKLKMIGLLVDAVRLFRALPRVPRPGATLKQLGLTPIAFREPHQLEPLLKHVANVALARGIQYMFCVCEADNPLLKGIEGFIRVDTAIHLYVKPLRQNALEDNRPVYIDVIDL